MDPLKTNKLLLSQSSGVGLRADSKHWGLVGPREKQYFSMMVGPPMHDSTSSIPTRPNLEGVRLRSNRTTPDFDEWGYGCTTTSRSLHVDQGAPSARAKKIIQEQLQLTMTNRIFPQSNIQTDFMCPLISSLFLIPLASCVGMSCFDFGCVKSCFWPPSGHLRLAKHEQHAFL